MKTNTLHDLFLDSIRDMYYAEQQLTQALPAMAETATHDELRAAFESHLAETEGHVRKLGTVFTSFGVRPKAKKCPAIVGIIKEANEIAAENKNSATLNAALVFAAQKAEHYEIASYGTLREWANLLGKEDVAVTLGEILRDERRANEKLTELAEEYCNQQANVSEPVSQN